MKNPNKSSLFNNKDVLYIFKNFVENAKCCFTIFDAKGNILFINNSAKSLLTIDHIETNPYLNKYLVDKFLKFIRKKIYIAIDEKKPCSFEYNIETKDRNFWYDFFLTPIKNKNETWHVLAIFRDVTKQKEFYHQVLNAKKDWERSIDSISDVIAISDSSFRIKRVNKTLANLLETTPQEMVGKICYKSLHKRNNFFPFCPLLDDMSSDNFPYNFIEKHLYRDLVFSVSPIYNYRNGVSGCAYIGHDTRQYAGVLEKQNYISSEKRINDMHNILINIQALHSLDNKTIKDGNFYDEKNKLLNLLSFREKEILKLIYSGMTTKEIAEKLIISAKTVETHRFRIMRKMGVKKSTSLIKKAVDYELI